jgi:ribonuclease HI
MHVQVGRKRKRMYVVCKGRQLRIYTTWEECEQQVKGFSKTYHKSFKLIKEAKLKHKLKHYNHFRS